jgi:nucleotide-binding universal stress UspA family protein
MSSFRIKKILVPVDFSGTGEKALEQAVLLAKKSNAEITLVTVIDGPLSNTGEDYFGTSIYDRPKYEKMILEWADKHLAAFKGKMIKNGVVKVKCIVEYGTPYRKILTLAKKMKADIIVMGTHGVSGVREFIIGSNAFRIVSEANCPVLSIQKRIIRAGFKQILLPFRDKPHSREKVDYAIGIAKLYGATIHIFGVSPDSSTGDMKKLQLEATQIKNFAEKQGVKCTLEVVKGNYVAKFILGQAKKKKSDLIVLMSDLDKMAISQFILGPVIQQVVNHSPIPVLSIHPLINPKLIQYDNIF